jgi:hypothetical protein
MDGIVYLHPIGMLAVIALGFAVLRDGLRIRDARMRRRPFDSRRHRRLAKLFVVLMAIGWAAGVSSMVLLRNQPMFASIHWPFGSSALALIGVAGAIGLQMERGRWLDRRVAHVAFGACGMLFAVGAAVAGMSILP